MCVCVHVFKCKRQRCFITVMVLDCQQALEEITAQGIKLSDMRKKGDN